MPPQDRTKKALLVQGALTAAGGRQSLSKAPSIDVYHCREENVGLQSAPEVDAMAFRCQYHDAHSGYQRDHHGRQKIY